MTTSARPGVFADYPRAFAIVAVGIAILGGAVWALNPDDPLGFAWGLTLIAWVAPAVIVAGWRRARGESWVGVFFLAMLLSWPVAIILLGVFGGSHGVSDQPRG